MIYMLQPFGKQDNTSAQGAMAGPLVARQRQAKANSLEIYLRNFMPTCHQAFAIYEAQIIL